MKFDEILDHIGQFGTYQKRLYVIVCIPTIFTAMQAMSILFIMDIPPHRCSLGPNDTYKVQNEDHARLINASIPWEREAGRDQLSSCYRYKVAHNASDASNDTEKCQSWVYDKSVYETTATEQYHIVCDNKILRSHSNMATWGATVFGAIMTGIISDIVGRRPVVITTILIQLACTFSLAFAPNIYVFIGLRMMGELTRQALFMTTVILVLEFVGPLKRVLCGIAINFFFTFGLYALVLVGYLIRNWQTLQLVNSGISVIMIVIWFVIPESPRWLLSRGRYKDAEAIIRKVARVNGADEEKVSQLFEQVEKETNEGKMKITEMFTSKRLLGRSLIIFFNWFSISLIYFGLTLNVQNLIGNIYTNFSISTSMELAAYIICMFTMDRVGRKILHCSSMLLGGLACIATMFPVLFGDSSVEWVTIALSMLGKLGGSMAFAIIYVYAAELFPTGVRNSGLGVSNTCGGIGSMIAPYMADLGVLVGGNLKVALPQIVIGSVAVVAGSLALTLPETLNKKLPETIDDAKHMGRKSRYEYTVSVTNGDVKSKGDVKLDNMKEGLK